MTEVAFLSAAELLTRFRSRQLSPVEAAEACLKQIDKYNPAVNAVCLVDADRTLEQARASERRWQSGDPAGPLDGVPTAIKDVFLTAGWPTLKGSKLSDPNLIEDVDAPAVAALREAGAVFIGKTTTPELGWKGVTDSPLSGPTRNPWDPSRTAGGSSGGSAAALMLGMGTLATGTDAGGSIRIPASFCGHPGIKPTLGRVPHWPPPPYGTLAQAGPMARDVADLALMMDVLVRPDPRDWTSLPPETVKYRECVELGVKGLRIAFSPDLGRVRVDPEVAGLVAAAVEVFADLGAQVEHETPGFADPDRTFEVLWNCSAVRATRMYSDEQLELLDPGLKCIADEGRGCSIADYMQAVQAQAELGVTMGLFHQRWDLLLTPTMPIPAFEAGRDVPVGWQDYRWQSWTPFTYPFNITQQPAASVPCGFTESGLPVGLQIVGARNADALVLQAAAAYERARPSDRRPPMLKDHN
ncbi:MAG: amidase [Actinomycetota bacterium]